ncbi:hypothetical protein TanjilG_15800 [Lupinus angustifolius]|uniref:mRNA guanylyltransferase n=1 Tax=Lupinus angustifolius TaxID=3871 RepID=A0A1J7FNM4_LUPAN|nr:hypothetical protein TanjilG_15800 [Lupinus angustifolius]
MDLNASPVPEEEEDIFEGQTVEEYSATEERVESAVDIARREREERKRRLKRERPDDRPVHVSQSPGYDQLFRTKTLKSYERSRLPPGWLECPSFGQEICCMVPSKVPLGESFNDCIFPGKRYSFKQVIHQQRVLGRKLGLVIDLTNTSRYYPVSDLKKEGIKHVKIQCKGRDSVPDNLAVNQFVYEVTQFLVRQKHSKKYILVHCTHGHNRTGYMIIHYLMRSMSMSVTQVTQFLVRQKHSKKYILVHCTHGHNRTGYMIIHYLMRSMSMSVTQAIKRFSDARPPGIYKPDYIDGLYTFYHEKKPEMVVCPPTPEWKRSSELDLNGEAIPDDDDDGIPDPQLHEIHETDTRMTNDDVLGDEIPNDQQEAFRQFCYQSLKLGIGRPFYERWKMLEKEVIEPRNHERHNGYKSKNPYYRYDLEPFRVRRKDFWLLSTVNKLLKEFIKRLSHEADGLIFQVDGDRQLLYINERGKKKLMEGNTVAFGDGSDPALYSGKIIECSRNPDTQEWVFMRVRTDKSTPNEFNTYKKVMRSIRDNITQEDLLDEINEIIRLPMYADRIQIDSKANQHAAMARRR